jgi:hypothetical protein
MIVASFTSEGSTWYADVVARLNEPLDTLTTPLESAGPADPASAGPAEPRRPGRRLVLDGPPCS